MRLNPPQLRMGLVVLVLTLVLSASALGQTSDPVQFVFAFNRDVAVQLGSTTIDAAERKRRFGAMIDEILDLDVIGERLLGWRWTQATPGDRQAFRQAFRDYLIHSFAMKVTGLDDDRMAVTSVLPDDRTVLVLTEVTTKGAARVSFAWRVVRTATGWRLCDVAVDNVSAASIMRSQFDSILPDGQPDIGPLLRLLHEKSDG